MGFLQQPWSGESFKIWAVVGAGQGIVPWLAIPTFIFARTLRMLVNAGVGGILGS